MNDCTFDDLRVDEQSLLSTLPDCLFDIIIDFGFGFLPGLTPEQSFKKIYHMLSPIRNKKNWVLYVYLLNDFCQKKFSEQVQVIFNKKNEQDFVSIAETSFQTNPPFSLSLLKIQQNLFSLGISKYSIEVVLYQILGFETPQEAMYEYSKNYMNDSFGIENTKYFLNGQYGNQKHFIKVDKSFVISKSMINTTTEKINNVLKTSLKNATNCCFQLKVINQELKQCENMIQVLGITKAIDYSKELEYEKLQVKIAKTIHQIQNLFLCQK